MKALWGDWPWRDEVRGAPIASDQANRDNGDLAGMKVFRSGGVQCPLRGDQLLGGRRDGQECRKQKKNPQSEKEHMQGEKKERRKEGGKKCHLAVKVTVIGILHVQSLGTFFLLLKCCTHHTIVKREKHTRARALSPSHTHTRTSAYISSM